MGEQKCYKLTAGFWTYLKPVAIFDTLHAKLHDIRTPLKLRNTMFGIINSVWITAIFKYKQADGEDKSVYGSRFFRANGAMKLKFFRPNKHLCCHKFRSVAIWILGNTIQSEVSQSIITFRLRKKSFSRTDLMLKLKLRKRNPGHCPSLLNFKPMSYFRWFKDFVKPNCFKWQFTCNRVANTMGNWSWLDFIKPCLTVFKVQWDLVVFSKTI